MKKIEYQKIALDKFKKEFLQTENTFELRAFISGWQSCEESYLKEDNKRFVIKNLDAEDSFISLNNNYVSIDNAIFFNKIEIAEKYKNIYTDKNWEIKELYFKTFSI